MESNNDEPAFVFGKSTLGVAAEPLFAFDVELRNPDVRGLGGGAIGGAGHVMMRTGHSVVTVFVADTDGFTFLFCTA